MPSRKKSPLPKDSTIELESGPSPWLLAYKNFSGNGELQEGETTIRQFAKLIGKNRNTAKTIISNMVKDGLAECVGKKFVEQDGLRPASVNVYRLTNGNDKS